MAMNSEPSGTDEDIPGGESAIDIFILCKDARDSQQLIGQLTPAGYRVTLFSDSTDLLESLRAGKPNLLICDTTDPENDGYGICRQIKTDGDLWRVPVLLVTGVASLGDLLIVLDSNADNFIARPYDPQYLLSLVDTMLTSPVEKPDPEKIRTQFKIQHEDREYVITADRRKLLEFLLSSFEMAVGRTADLGQTQNALDALKSTLERRVAERTSELSTETARIQTVSNGLTRDLESARNNIAGLKKEGETLRSRLEEREMVIAAKKEELTRFTEELETTRSRLAEAEDTIHTLGTEKDELEHALRGDAETLNRDLEQTRVNLTAAKAELSEVSRQREALSSQFDRLTHDHEEAEKALGTRSIEIEQLKSDLAGEKNRADAAEQEVKSILQEKARSEQDLRQMVEDITGKAKQQSQESLRLADELAAEKERRENAEQQYSEFVQEASKKEAGFVAEKGTLMEHHDSLQQKYDALTESVGAERQKSATLAADLSHVTEAKEQTARDMQVLKEQLDATVSALEEETRLRTSAETSIQEVTETKEGELRALNATLSALRQDVEMARAGLVAAAQQQDAAADAHKNLSDELAAAVLAKAESDKLARSVASEIEQVRQELATERRLRHVAEEKLSEVMQVKENIELNLHATSEQTAAKEKEQLEKIRSLSDSLASEREARRTADEKLSEVTQVKENIEQNLQAASGQIAAKEKEQLEKIQGLSDSLATEQEARRTADETLARVTREKEQAEQDLRTVTDSKVADDTSREDKLKKLGDDLTTALDRQRSLEDQLREAEREQATKEAALRTLAAGIEQAGAALAAEKEERHAAQEACAEAKEALAALRKRTQIPTATIEEVPIQNRAMVVKGPDLPTVILHGPQALSRKEIDPPVLVQRPADPERPTAAAITDAPQVRIRTVEDLFEEPKELDINDLSDAIPVSAVPPAEAAGNAPVISGDDTPDAADDDETAPEEGEPEEEDTAEDDDEETGDDETNEGDDGSTSDEAQLPEGIPAFSRQQWFDLMKWAHNADALTHEDRIRIVKLGRLLKQGRRLTGRQEAQLEELVTLACARGYRPKE
jgi:DNA-binding response OmpR family regulator/predicted  nucleic acid-binding Zn-ribbon protein